MLLPLISGDFLGRAWELRLWLLQNRTGASCCLGSPDESHGLGDHGDMGQCKLVRQAALQRTWPGRNRQYKLPGSELAMPVRDMRCSVPRNLQLGLSEAGKISWASFSFC